MCSLMAQVIDQAHPAAASAAIKKHKPMDKWDRAFAQGDEAGSWRV